MTALETIWEQMSTRLRYFILTRVEDDAAADDLLQEVFMRVHQNMGQLKQNEKLEQWIFQITRNVIIDHYRTRHPQTELSEKLSDPNTEVEDADALADLTDSIQRMVNELPTPYREALQMTEYQGLSQQALADRLGISISGAKSRVQRARQKIKEGLLACCHFEFDRYGRVVDYWDACYCCSEAAHFSKTCQ
jgi:RNA polymerase sigma-70 factor, ECF subfamily